MRNKEQERAAHALEACEDKKRFQTKNEADVTKTMATMVQDCGLLPSLAFALESKVKPYEKNCDNPYREVFKAFVSFMGKDKMPLQKYLEEITRADSAELRHVTAECLAYLSYLRRFANIECSKRQNDGQAE